MKTFADLVKFIQSGNKPVVTFQGTVEDFEGYAEKGMRARLTGAHVDRDDVVRLALDFAPFEAHNLPLESSNYFDKSGSPTLNARDAGYYTPQDHVYVMLDQDISMYFHIEDDAALALFAEYERACEQPGTSLTYVQWLETQLLAERRK